LHEVCNHCYVPGIHEPGHTTELIVNPKVWERLSPWQQEIMRAAGWQECTDMLAQFNHENARSLQTLRQFKKLACSMSTSKPKAKNYVRPSAPHKRP
jgi:TRAP-type mannitol/chloroaromatic compound transport system substrate-binding protein